MAAPNPCVGAPLRKELRPAEEWAVHLPWVPSVKSLTAYAEHHGHAMVYNRQVSPPRPTFDDKALDTLTRKYPEDVVYGGLRERRQIEKCLSTYVEGIGPFLKPSGRVCGEFKHAPLTLRLSQQTPSLLNLPRQEAGDHIYNVVRDLYVAAPGHILAARDYAGIEARLVGWLAGDPDYIRITGIDAHTFLVSHMPSVNQPADLTWDDARLRAHLKQIKATHGRKRQSAKKVQHAANYLATAAKLKREEPTLFASVKEAQDLMTLYHGLFPKIGEWQRRTVRKVHDQGYITAPSGFRLHYAEVLTRTYSKTRQCWEEDFAEAAKEAVAGVPQHMGAYILFRAAVAMCEAYPAFADMIRLLIHDEILYEVREEEADLWDARLQDVMERPIPCLPLDPAWGMGSHLRIGTDGKRGARWSTMR